MDELGPIERHNVSGHGFIGSLYDARTDKFEGSNLFNKDLPDTFIQTTDNAHADYTLDYNNSQKETFNNLNINASLKLSLLGGLVDISGSASYLKQTKRDNHTVRVTYVCKMETKQDHLQISMAELHKYFSSDALNNSNATHVVTGILWGANVAAIFEKKVENIDAVTDLEGKLSVALKAIPISGNAELKLQDTDKSLFESLKISFSGDVLPNEFEPKIDGTMKVFSSISSLIEPLNKGKGKPLVYTMFPLKRVAEIFKHDLQIDRILHEISKTITLEIENIFEDMVMGKRKFNEFISELKLWEQYISYEWKKTISDRRNELAGVELKTQRELGTLLTKVRSGDTAETEMDIYAIFEN